MNRLFYHKCEECTYKTTLLSNVNIHAKFHQNPLKELFDCSIPLNKGIDQYKCYTCLLNFQTPLLSQLNRHIAQNHTSQNFHPQIYKCQKCKFKSFSRYLILRHQVIDKHLTVKQIKKRAGFYCETCDYRANRKADLHRHVIRKHTNEAEIKWYSCDKCPFRGKLKTDLNNHQKVHTTKTLQCKKCTFRAKTKYTLDRHVQKVHVKPEDIEWLHCDNCAYKAKNKTLLVMHIRTQHNDHIKWHRCPHCSYKSKLKTQLHTHQVAMHALVADVKYYQCPQCPYKASMPSAIKNHVKTKHSSNFFNCGHCDFKTKYKHNLEKHVIVTHTPPEKIQWFECNQCEFKSKLKGIFFIII